MSDPVLPLPLPPPAVVAALRAAGCVFAEDEARLIVSAAVTPADLAGMVARRAAGEPLEQVLGWAEFCGLRIALDPGVFVPRRRTEFLVSQAVAVAGQPAPPDGRTPGPARHAAGPDGRTPGPDGEPGTGPRPVVVDLCCGSGAVGAALAAALGPVELHAADIDPAAVACARRNITAAGGQVHRGDLYDALPVALRGRVAILAANVPYVPTGAVGGLPAEARLHEPRVALDGGPDGLGVLRRVAAGAPAWLAPGGCLLIEVSEQQAPAALEAFGRSGLAARLAQSADWNATVVIGSQAAGR